MKLLTPAHANAKTAKNEKFSQFDTYILHLAPYNLSGVNVCPSASAGCAAACLNSAGRGAFSNVQEARKRKTIMLIKQRAEFIELLQKDLDSIMRKSAKTGKKPVVRLNGTSDLNWSAIKLADGRNVFEAYPTIQFYDYTKVLARLKMTQYPNYDLTFSRSETNEAECRVALSLGFRVAAVFADGLPSTYLDAPVVDGDSHDLRFLDNKGVIVGLKAKGKAKRDASGFVINSCKSAKKGA